MKESVDSITREVELSKAFHRPVVSRRKRLSSVTRAVSVPDNVPRRWSCDEMVYGHVFQPSLSQCNIEDVNTSNLSSTTTVCPDFCYGDGEESCAFVEVLSVTPTPDDVIYEDEIVQQETQGESYGLQVRIVASSRPNSVNSIRTNNNLEGEMNLKTSSESQFCDSMFGDTHNYAIKQNELCSEDNKSETNNFGDVRLRSRSNCSRNGSNRSSLFETNPQIHNCEIYEDPYFIRSRRSASRDSSSSRSFIGIDTGIIGSPSVRRYLLKVPITPTSSPHEKHVSRISNYFPQSSNEKLPFDAVTNFPSLAENDKLFTGEAGANSFEPKVIIPHTASPAIERCQQLCGPLGNVLLKTSPCKENFSNITNAAQSSVHLKTSPEVCNSNMSISYADENQPIPNRSIQSLHDFEKHQQLEFKMSPYRGYETSSQVFPSTVSDYSGKCTIGLFEDSSMTQLTRTRGYMADTTPSGFACGAPVVNDLVVPPVLGSDPSNSAVLREGKST